MPIPSASPAPLLSVGTLKCTLSDVSSWPALPPERVVIVPERPSESCACAFRLDSSGTPRPRCVLRKFSLGEGVLAEGREGGRRGEGRTWRGCC